MVKYPLDIPVSLGRARVRSEFEKSRRLSDLPVINVLLLKGTQDLIEAHNKWKQRTHIMRYFDANDWDPQVRLAKQTVLSPLQRQASTFLKSFLKQK